MNKAFTFPIRLILATIVLLALLSPIAARADEGAEQNGTIGDIFPDNAESFLPDMLLSPDDDAVDAAELTGADRIFGMIIDMLKNALAPATSFFSVILGTVLISSAVGILSRDISGGRLYPAVSMISCLSLSVFIITAEERLADSIGTFAASVSTFTAAMVPMMAGLLSASANTAGAAVTSSGLLLFSSAAEYIVTYIFIPIFRLGLAFAVISSVSGSGSGANSICGTIKRTFSWLAAGAATIFSTVISYQTQLAAAADTAAARSVKYAIGSAIPVVGGALGDAVRTTAAGLSVIKSGAGAVGIAAMIALFSPLFISTLYITVSLAASAFCAELLGCERESRLLSELREITGFATAICSLLAFVFIFALALFIKTAPAIS